MSDQNKKRTTMTLSPELVDAIDEYSEESHLKSRSQAVEMLTRKQLEDDEEVGDDERRTATDGGRVSRSVSPLTLLGIVSLAIAPTLLVSGYTYASIGAGAVGLSYLALYVTAYDVLLERRLAGLRDDLADAGGVVGFFRKLIREIRAVEDPDTVVERCANADILGIGLFLLAALFIAPMWAFSEYVGVAAVVEALGVTGVLLYVVVVLALLYLGVLALGVSALSMLAIASAEDGSETVSPTDTTADAGE